MADVLPYLGVGVLIAASTVCCVAALLLALLGPREGGRA